MAELSRPALVVIDLQERLAEVMDCREQLIRNCSILIKAFRILDLPIICCRQYPQGLGDYVPAVRELLSDIDPVDKSDFSCCRESEFHQKINEAGVSRLILCGIEAHVCVYQTAVQLTAKGFHIEIASDAVSSRTPQNRKIGLERIKAEGGIMTSTEMFIFEQLKTAEHPKFKEISRLVK